MFPAVFVLRFLAACGRPSVPSALEGLEGTAEDAYDAALASDDAALGADASTLATGWGEFRETAARRGAAGPRGRTGARAIS